MQLERLVALLRRELSIPQDNPDLVRAQYAAHATLVPALYLLVVANNLMVAASFLDKAPPLLTVLCPLALSGLAIWRLLIWRRRRGQQDVSAEVAVTSLRQMHRFTLWQILAYSLWGAALFPYGDDLARSHVVLFVSLSMMACTAGLLHVRRAAISVAVLFSAFLIGMSLWYGSATLLFMSVNSALGAAAMVAFMLLESRNFANMVAARSAALRLSAERRVQDQEQHRLARMIADMPLAVMTIDLATFRINYMNDAMVRLMRQLAHLLPMPVEALIGTPIDVFHAQPEKQRALISDPANLPHRTRVHLGPEVVELEIAAVRGADGAYIGAMASWSLVTQQLASEQRILQLAHYDALTGLANRTTFQTRMESALRRDVPLALLIIDLDGFKMVNDSKGHHVGDALLVQVAERLRSRYGRRGVTIGRLGGDEFTLLVEEIDPDSLPGFASALIEALVVPPYQIGPDRSVQIGASVGMVYARTPGTTADALLSRADIALYAAKAAGKGTWKLFESQMEARLQERVQMEGRLRAALDSGTGLQVHYQPIVDLRTRRVTAREALVRWQDAPGHWVPPGEFVPVAEESGLIDRLGAFVLAQACRDAAGWQSGVRVAVNVSPGQLGRGQLRRAVQSALASSGLAAGRLELEVTESALLNHVDISVAELREVHALGVRVALDDFGTGFSSLAHLRAFPFDKIKIDGSFVRDAVARPDCAAVVKAVADLGKRLGVTTVAEGVETMAHLERVILEGCTEVQGYLLGRPVPNDTPDPPLVAWSLHTGLSVEAVD